MPSTLTLERTPNVTQDRSELKYQLPSVGQGEFTITNEQDNIRNGQFEVKHTVQTVGFFRVSSQGITGDMDSSERKIVSTKLGGMKEGSEAIGEVLEMNTVGYVAMYEGDSTIAYRYDPESDPNIPHLIGAVINQRVPMGDLLKKIFNERV